MGHRVMKRVPLNFVAPLNKVWKGYINPYRCPVRCNICDGSGYNPATRQIADGFNSYNDISLAWRKSITQEEVQLLVDAGHLKHLTHTWEFGIGYKRRDDGYVPTVEDILKIEREGGLFTRGLDDGCELFLVEHRAKKLGVFGKCLVCRGKGSKYPAHVPRRPYRAWKDIEPLTGEGYQLWETTSEGSPMSPVFASAQELARWCTDNACIFADHKTSYENWLSMFTEDSLDAGSMYVIQPGFAGALINASA